MKNILKQITQWLWEHKKLLMVLVLASAWIMHPDLVQAATDGSSGTSGDNSDTLKSLAELANVLVRFLNTLLWPLLLIIGDLLDVDMIIGPGMEERLIAIWVEMRNLVNIVIALVLVVVAFYNVLGLGGGEGELAIKTALPKIVLGLILVNFTYVGGKVILDVANVGTTIAFSLPQIMEQSNGAQFDVNSQLDTFEDAVCLPALTVTDKGADGVAGTDDDKVTQKFYNKSSAPIQTKLFCQLLTEDSEVSEAKKDEYYGLRESFKSTYFSDLNKNNIAIVMAVNMGSLGSLELFKSGAVADFKDLTVNTIFALVMYLVFAVSYVVLAAVLVVRLVVLWLALALSPVAVLVYVVPQIKEWLGGGGGDFSQKVIKHLVAPIIIGVTLSMGFLLMEGWSVVAHGSFNAYSDSKVSEVISSEFLVSGIDDLPKLILAIASIVVVWMGVFAAANDTYASALTEKIQGFGGQVRDALFNVPFVFGSLPISVSGEDKQQLSPMALKQIMTGTLEQFNSGALVQDELSQIKGNPIVDFALGRSGSDRNPTLNASRFQELLSGINGTSVNRQEAAELAKTLANSVEGSTTMKTDDRTAMVKELRDLAENIDTARATDLQDIIRRYESKKDSEGNNYDAEDFGVTNSSANGLTKAKKLSIMGKEESERDIREKEEKSKRDQSDKDDSDNGNSSSARTSTGTSTTGNPSTNPAKPDDKPSPAPAAAPATAPQTPPVASPAAPPQTPPVANPGTPPGTPPDSPPPAETPPPTQ